MRLWRRTLGGSWIADPFCAKFSVEDPFQADQQLMINSLITSQIDGFYVVGHD